MGLPFGLASKENDLPSFAGIDLDQKETAREARNPGGDNPLIVDAVPPGSVVANGWRHVFRRIARLLPPQPRRGRSRFLI
jgi:hypothetical protein